MRTRSEGDGLGHTVNCDGVDRHIFRVLDATEVDRDRLSRKFIVASSIIGCALVGTKLGIDGNGLSTKTALGGTGIEIIRDEILYSEKGIEEKGGDVV